MGIKVLGMDGTVISANGMEEIQKLGKEAFVLWEQLVPACVDLGSLYVLRSNSEPRRGEAMAILSKLMEKIASDPDNVKYRQISRLNRKIKDQLLSANGAIGVLRSVGFREHGDMLVMPMAASLMALNRFRNAIRSMHENTPDSVSLPVPEEDSTSSQPSIMCPICFTSLSDILSKGSSLVSTVCGHLFCSWCLPSCLLASPKCPPAGSAAQSGTITQFSSNEGLSCKSLPFQISMSEKVNLWFSWWTVFIMSW